jgi:hypothetical protein
MVLQLAIGLKRQGRGTDAAEREILLQTTPMSRGCERSTEIVPFEGLLLQTHINFPRFLPIFPGFLKRLSHLAPIY